MNDKLYREVYSLFTKRSIDIPGIYFEGLKEFIPDTVWTKRNIKYAGELLEQYETIEELKGEFETIAYAYGKVTNINGFSKDSFNSDQQERFEKQVIRQMEDNLTLLVAAYLFTEDSEKKAPIYEKILNFSYTSKEQLLLAFQVLKVTSKKTKEYELLNSILSEKVESISDLFLSVAEIYSRQVTKHNNKRVLPGNVKIVGLMLEKQIPKASKEWNQLLSEGYSASEILTINTNIEVKFNAFTGSKIKMVRLYTDFVCSILADEQGFLGREVLFKNILHEIINYSVKMEGFLGIADYVKIFVDYIPDDIVYKSYINLISIERSDYLYKPIYVDVIKHPDKANRINEYSDGIKAFIYASTLERECNVENTKLIERLSGLSIRQICEQSNNMKLLGKEILLNLVQLDVKKDKDMCANYIKLLLSNNVDIYEHSANIIQKAMEASISLEVNYCDALWSLYDLKYRHSRDNMEKLFKIFKYQGENFLSCYAEFLYRYYPEDYLNNICRLLHQPNLQNYVTMENLHPIYEWLTDNGYGDIGLDKLFLTEEGLNKKIEQNKAIEEEKKAAMLAEKEKLVIEKCKEFYNKERLRLEKKEGVSILYENISFLFRDNEYNKIVYKILKNHIIDSIVNYGDSGDFKLIIRLLSTMVEINELTLHEFGDTLLKIKEY